MIYFLTVNYYSSELIAKLITSISKNTEVLYKVLIINNSPDDTSIHQLKAGAVLLLEAERNLGFGKACNLGLNWIYSQDPHSIVWIINPDTYLIEDVLEKVTTFFNTHPEVSIAGTVIYTEIGDIWFAGGYYNPRTGEISAQNTLSNNQDLTYISSDWVSGCSLIINLDKFKTCPQFDPSYFLYYEDFDFCKRYKNEGHLVVVTPKISVVHQPSSITNRSMFNKIKHSTFSYLLTLERYTNKLVLIIRLTRLVIYAIALLAIKPQTAFGKLYGVLLYLQHRI